jgi:CheY-like chemotaxis protein
MPVINGLIVDDLAKQIEVVTSRLSRECGKFDWEIAWTQAKGVDEGQRIISSATDPFDLVVADLLFPRLDLPDEYEEGGLDLISDARQRSRHTFILAISTGRDHLHELWDEAKRRGAHHVVRRIQFSPSSKDHSPAAIAAEIREHLVDNGTVVLCDVAADDLDPAVQGLLNEVGRPTVAQLHRKVLEGYEHTARQIHVRFLSPGASGASVCAVTTQLDGIGQLSHVLKLSRARDLLLREAERGQRAADVLAPNLLLQQRTARPVGPVNGWYALGGRLVERATTFRAWLASGPSPSVVEDILEALFVEGLGPLYAEAQSVSMEPLESFAFSYYRQRRILHALGELEETLSRPDGGGLSHATSELVTDLTAFITERRLLLVPLRAIPRQTYTCYVHGDLHGGNVLVSAGLRPLPLLIDPSEFGQAHWASDAACLAVDVLMSGVDAGAESMFFAGFDTWRTLASGFSAGAHELAAVTATAANSAALTALSWLAVNLPRFSPAVDLDGAQGHRWEWHVALATYLLRATYHADTPPPKRALAFVAANDQLAAAAAAIPASRSAG